MVELEEHVYQTIMEALTFYADPDNWYSDTRFDIYGAAFDDEGTKARDALKTFHQ